MFKDWNEVEKKFSHQFDLEPTLNNMLLIIGIQESGEGFQKYTQMQKTELLKLGYCTVLSKWKFFISTGQDEKNWPVWKSFMPFEHLPEKEQEDYIKKGIWDYFNRIYHEE